MKMVVNKMLERVDIAPGELKINDPAVYRRWAMDGFKGFGETYMEGGWDCDRIDELCCRLIESGLWQRKSGWMLRNLQSLGRAREVCERHYDLGNDLFRAMLDERMVYTCAYWENATTLAEAQEAKLEMVCRKLGLAPGMRVLDIGCGFGSFMKYAAMRYGVTCVGYSLSREQIRLGREMCEGLPITFVEEDYRNIKGKFDRVVSIGMFEAVGHKNFREFMKVVSNALIPGGSALLHTMGGHVSRKTPEPWFDKYIFPNGLIPSLAQVSKAMEGLLIVDDLHCIGKNYDPTLMAWNENFQRAWPALSKKYDERFKRMWEFYLLSLAGCFRAGHVDIWQFVLRRPGY